LLHLLFSKLYPKYLKVIYYIKSLKLIIKLFNTKLSILNRFGRIKHHNDLDLLKNTLTMIALLSFSGAHVNN